MPNPVELLARYLEAAQEPKKKRIEETLMEMKRSQDSEKFGAILAIRYAKGIDLRQDVGGYALGHGQAYNYANAYFKREDEILAEWEALLGVDENLRIFKTPKMIQLLNRYNRYKRQYLYTPLVIQADQQEEEHDWTPEENNRLKQNIMTMIRDHRLTRNEIRDIVRVQEDFIWSSKTANYPRSVHFGNLFELVRYANYARFILVFGEMFVEQSFVAAMLALQPGLTTAQAIALAPPGLWHFIIGLNHIGFTQMGFNVYVIQISVMIAEFAKLWYHTYQESKDMGIPNHKALWYSFQDAFKNYWFKPGKASDFVNAAVWMTLGLLATFAFPSFGPLIFVVGFWFDALHAGFFLAKTVWFDNKKRLKLRDEELRDIHSKAANADQEFDVWYQALKAVVIQQRADRKKIPILEERYAKIRAKLTKLENASRRVGANTNSIQNKIRTLNEELEQIQAELSECEITARDPSPNGFDPRAIKAMHDIQRIREERRAAIKQVIGSVVLGIVLAIGFSMAVYAFAASPVAAAVGTAIMFAAMVVFVGQKYYGLYKKRKLASHRQEYDQEGELNESEAFAEVRAEVKAEKQLSRQRFFSCGRKQAGGYQLVHQQNLDVEDDINIRVGVACC